MRKVSLSDEELDSFDQFDIDEERRESRRRDTVAGLTVIDAIEEQFPEEDQEIMDLVDQLDAGVVDYE